jgi:hopene-associated glycosyltransferase HpnB
MPEIFLSALAAVALLIWIVLALLHGGFWRVRLPAECADPLHWPAVSAVVPARDEADVIEGALSSLLRQDYPGAFHVFLVDDHSSDGTAAVARAAAAKLKCEDRLTVVAARDLPAGWAGKVWAQSEGLAALRAAQPQARYVFLTDADIGHGRHTVRQLVARAEAEQRVLTSLMVRLRCNSFAEKALIPAFVFFFAMLYPFARVNNPRSKVAAAAGGCMLARADALQRIGGIAAIKDALIDDCALGAKMKQQGSIRLDLAQDSYSLRPYNDWRSIWNMIARSAYTQLRHSVWLLLGTVLGMLLIYVAPPALTLLWAAGQGHALWPALSAWLIMAAVYLPMLRYYDRSPLWAPALPLVALFYLAATLGSAWRYWQGRGGQWKGRNQAPAQR